MRDMVGTQSIEIGKKYRNIKTGGVYEVLLISQNSEDPLELLVIYQKESDILPWSRSLNLFVVKFEESDD